MNGSHLRARVALTIVIALLLCLSFGCATKAPRPIEPVTKTGKKKTKSKATQRPYVINGITYYPIPSAVGYVERGLASWYGEPFHGQKTSNGEIYNMYGDTAAHKTLPMDTMLLVKNLENGRSTMVRINDRGPFVQERIIDLTYTKAQSLGLVGKGTAKVEIIAMATQEVEEEALVATTPTAAGKKAPPAQPKAKKGPPIPDFDKGNFYVQVGAFVKIENARILAKAFAKRGRDVIIQQYPAAGMNLYRVLIFASNSLAKAKQYEQQMKNEGFRYALLLAR